MQQVLATDDVPSLVVNIEMGLTSISLGQVDQYALQLPS